MFGVGEDVVTKNFLTPTWRRVGPLKRATPSHRHIKRHQIQSPQYYNQPTNPPAKDNFQPNAKSHENSITYMKTSHHK